MLARASRPKLPRHASKHLQPSPADFYLPWLCPALYPRNPHRRPSSTLTPIYPTQTKRPLLHHIKTSDPTPKANPSRPASASAFNFVHPGDEYVPFENPPPRQLFDTFRLPWMTDATHQPFDLDQPIVIKDSLTTKSPRFRSFDAITGELADLVTTMKACLHVGRFERAAALMRRLNAIYRPESPALLAAHNDYIRETAWKIVSTRDQRLLNNLQAWFEVELRARGVSPDATTYAFMIQAVLQDVRRTRSARSIRRYIHLAEEQGLRDELMNVLLLVLNEQDVGLVTSFATVDRNTQVAASEALPDGSTSTAPTKIDMSNIAEVRPVDQELPGWKALRKSLSVFSDPSAISALDTVEGTEAEKVKRVDLERQLRMEQDTYESSIERWRSDHEDLKRMGINGSLQNTSVGALMWQWHEVLVLAVKEEIALANAAEKKAVKKPIDEDRCQYGPFLQYLDAKKLSAITILTCMTTLSTSRTGDRGNPVTSAVMSIGEAVQDESMAGFLKSVQFDRAYLRDLVRGPRVQEVTKLLKARRVRRHDVAHVLAGSSKLTAQALQEYQWGQPVKARLGAVLLSKLIDSAKIPVFRKHPETGRVHQEMQPAFLHQTLYHRGKRVGMLSLNSPMYDKLTTEPIAASLSHKHLPMVVEPKPWAGFREGGFLTSSEPMVRIPQGYEQGRRYCMVAAENGDMDQISAGLDVLSRTPWQINGPVFEVMLEAWNSGEAIASIAPDNLGLELPPEPVVEDKVARAKYLQEVRRIGSEKMANKSQRCYQNFQLEIARAYLNETFYFPHNVDFRGRAYPMSPLLNYMGADVCRGLLTFGVGKPLGANGLRWLKIHLANVYGYDKASFEERVVFAEDHRDDIFDAATNPLKGKRWWLQAEDPWQCLAACKELRNALTSPDTQAYVSKLAVHQDGTCNGLQHYAALGGDSIGAKQVNLEPSDRPSDIYTGVAEIVKGDIAEEAKQGHDLARLLDGKITRKVVKQTVMTNVYGVTFMGAKLQVIKQLKDFYPDLPSHSSAGAYVASKIFKALANMFNGAHDIQYWLGDCAGRIATAITPEQIERIEAVTAGTLNEPDEFQRTPLRRKAERGTKDELLAFKQSVIWTSPLKMPVVQPYRQKTTENVTTSLQRISLHNPSMADPVNKRKQLQAFPPNFIHSLDATHMLLSAMQCEKRGLTFTAVHDSFWTHPSDVDTMNGVLRDTFIKMHSEDIIDRLGAEFAIRYKGAMYMTAVKQKSNVGKKILQWRKSQTALNPIGKKLQNIHIREILLERRRLKLLASEKLEEREEGQAMVTANSIFESSSGEDDLAVENELEDLALGSTSSARANKLQANEQLTVGDEDNIGGMEAATTETTGLDAAVEESVVVEENIFIEDGNTQHSQTDVQADDAKPPNNHSLKPKKVIPPQNPLFRKVWLWRPLTFPPVPEKGEFDVSRIEKSQYFFS
ncbi:MAG: hypothetical protein Q9168_003778 [Polycauliona sp. 1 TL-2023]